MALSLPSPWPHPGIAGPLYPKELSADAELRQGLRKGANS